MRFICPSISTLSPSASQKTRSFARDSRRESLARIPEDGADPKDVLASVVSSRRLRTQPTAANLRTVVSAPNLSSVPPKRASTAHLMNDSEPFGRISFCEWYDTLTLEKRRLLMQSMIEVCEERSAGDTGKTAVPIDPNQVAFQWRMEGEKEDVMLQFTKWFTDLGEIEQNTALAYSGIRDGEKIEDLPTKEEVENADKENEQVANPLTKEPSFVEGSSSRSTFRDATSDPKSTAAKGKSKRLTREASSEVFNWAQSYVQKNAIVIPNVPVTRPTTSGAATPVDTVQDPQEGYRMVPFPLPKPPKRGYRAKLTRNGTLIVDDRGKPIFEKIPADVLHHPKGKAQSN